MILTRSVWLRAMERRYVAVRSDVSQSLSVYAVVMGRRIEMSVK